MTLNENRLVGKCSIVIAVAAIAAALAIDGRRATSGAKPAQEKRAGVLFTVSNTGGPESPPAASMPQSPLALYSIPQGSLLPSPRSLAGSSADGEFTVDETGRFVPDKSALLVFRYFFTASGEEPVDVIRGRIILQAVSQGLNADAMADFVATLDRYIAYRTAAKRLAGSNAWMPADLRLRLEKLRQLRVDTLGRNVADAFFAEEEAVARAEINRRAILKNEFLVESEKHRRLAELEETLPAEIRNARHAASMPAAIRSKVSERRASDGTEKEIFDLRAEAFGADAAKRLADLDRRNAAWREKYGQYAAERRAIVTEAGAISDADLATLRSLYFTADELLRVSALDGF
ncbi:lipase secretion chaperone [Hyphococcus sp.]|uniref:lipase secretion chaperone n=1 Tax=Hyphococcus sp. TaxID=2038636 RepID=UPI0035C70514